MPELPEVMKDGSPELIRFPISDLHIPQDAGAFRMVVRDLVDRVGQGRTVAITCRGGLDRSGLTAACFLREVGLGFDEAIGRVQAARGGSITDPDEQEFVRTWPAR